LVGNLYHSDRAILPPIMEFAKKLSGGRGAGQKPRGWDGPLRVVSAFKARGEPQGGFKWAGRIWGETRGGFKAPGAFRKNRAEGRRAHREDGLGRRGVGG